MPNIKCFFIRMMFIVYKNFIRDYCGYLTRIKEIGMIGMVGSPVMPAEGVMWADDRIGSLFTSNIKQAGPALIGPGKDAI